MHVYSADLTPPNAYRADLGAYRCIDPSPRRILVVDDDPDIWPAVRHAARVLDLDLCLDFAASATTAISRMLEPVRYDLVLIDDCLPRAGDGRSLVGTVDFVQPWAGTALMSGTSDIGNGELAFLPKPFSLAQCREFLSNLLH